MPAKRLLVLSHSRTGATARLTEAALGGVARVDGVAPVAVDVVDAGLDEVLAADATLLLTPARFGAVAGLTKDLFERIYPWFEAVPDLRPGMPWTMVAKGGSDPTGAVRDVERILTGLRWKQVLPPLVVTGELTDDHLAAADDLAATLAAGLTTDLW